MFKHALLHLPGAANLQATASAADLQKVDWDHISLHFGGLGLPAVLPVSVLWHLLA